jgi:predicted phage terminase large subunit-like protein
VRENRYYLLDVFRDRLLFPALLAKAIRHARIWGANKILIEDASSGKQLLQSLHADTNYVLEAIPPEGDKVTRLECVTHLIERGRLFLPENAAWLGSFLGEVLSFPNGRYDDQVDTLSHFLRWAMAHERNRRPRSNFISLGGNRIRDRYRERTGFSTFPKGTW